VSIAPNDADLRRRYGYMLFSAFRLTKAEEQLIRAAELDPDDKEVTALLVTIRHIERDIKP